MPRLIASIRARSGVFAGILCAGFSLNPASGQMAVPPPRAGAAFAFDDVRGVSVLYGGYTFEASSPYLGDTWEYDGSRWNLRAESGPRPWWSGGGAFDPIDRVVRVYNGSDGTWDWDGQSWTRRSAQYVDVGWGPGMAFDTRRGVMVLHGGWPTFPNPFWSNTWEGNGNEWRHVSEWGPIIETFASLVYDSWREVCVAFAGTRTWEWNGAQWTISPALGPPFRPSGGLAFDSWRGVTVMFGGEPIGETWEYDGAEWRIVAIDGPAPRDWHGMAFDSRRGVTVLFGGAGGGTVFNDTWEWDGKTWTLANPCYADCDTTTGERILDIFDFLCFGNRFAANDPYACDCDTTTGQGVCDVFDFLCFGNAFNAGCP